MDDGSPELTPETKRKYKFDSRFLDDMLRVSWDTAFTYAAKAMIVIATRYSGEAGARRLREQGYAPEMIEMMKGAGTRCFKHRAGMPVLGIIGKMGNTRMNGGVNALLDTWIRKVGPEQAQGGRYWSNYTWHGDQNPAQPWWSGAQDSDIDLSDMRFSKLNTSWGKNFVENKMPEAHWKLECIERGARIVVITPEYNPTAYRADYWMPVRPESDGALFLGRHEDHRRREHARHRLPQGLSRTCPDPGPDGYLAVPGSAGRGQGLRVPGLLEELFGQDSIVEAGADSSGLGGMMVWDLAKKQAVPLHREQVGWHYQHSGIDAALTGTYRVKLLNGREVDAMPIWQMYLVHFQDYDLDTVHQISRTPKDLIVRWARDSGTIKPAAIHNGEGDLPLLPS